LARQLESPFQLQKAAIHLAESLAISHFGGCASLKVAKLQSSYRERITELVNAQ
jgi:hypothetical protein